MTMDFSSQLASFQRAAGRQQNSQQQQQQQQNRQQDRNFSPGRRHHRSHDDSDRHRGHNKRQRRHHDNNNNDDSRYRRPSPWQEMRTMLANVPPFRLTKEEEESQQQQQQQDDKEEQESESTQKPFHLCLLAITIDDLLHQDIWRNWCESGTEDSMIVSLVGHAKHPERVRSDWFRSRLMVRPPKPGRGHEYAPPTYHSRRPEWGSIEITRAMIDLAQEALKLGGNDPESHDARFSIQRYAVLHNNNDKNKPLPPVDKVLFISETCLPVASLDDFYQKLSLSPHESWVNARDTPNNGYSRQQQFDRINSVIPRTNCYKADQWMCLARPHVRAVAQLSQSLPIPLWRCFTDTRASDELYFPTALGLIGAIPETQRRVTYADWTLSARNPASFQASDLAKVHNLATQEGCLVARKFQPPVDVQLWRSVVLPNADDADNDDDDDEEEGNEEDDEEEEEEEDEEEEEGEEGED